jgi:predicted nicotinamide N-methyase
VSFADLSRRYDLTRSTIVVREDGPRVAIELDHVRDINALVDQMTPEDFGPDERLPYWAVLWPAALDLARLVLELPAAPGPTLELGAGLGLVSLVLAHSGQAVVASDYEPDALALLDHNAARAGLSVDTRRVDWREVEAEHPVLRRCFQRIVGSDLVYEARNIEPLAQAIDFFAGDRAEVVVADPGRPYFPALTQALVAKGFAVEPAEPRSGVLRAARRPVGLLGQGSGQR